MKNARLALILSVSVLIAWGLVVLASAGETAGLHMKDPDPFHYLIRQLEYLALGTGICVYIARFFDYRLLLSKKWLLWGGYAVTVLLMVAVLFTRGSHGSHRWLSLGPVSVQPSEVGKCTIVIVLSALMTQFKWRVALFCRGLMPLVCSTGLLTALALLEPDLGSTFVMGITIAMLLWVGGARIWHMLVCGAVGTLGVLGMLVTTPNRMRRLLAFFPADAVKDWEPFLRKTFFWLDFNKILAHNQEANHQLKQAIVAICRPFTEGGASRAWYGMGFDKSMQRQRYLPENHTDFIFAIGAEEWGFIFSVVVLVAFTVVFIIGFYIARRCTNPFGRYLAFGISFLVYFQALFNLCVVSGLAPTKGIALPFLSFGGSNLVMSLVEVGLLLSIARITGLKNATEKSTIASVNL